MKADAAMDESSRRARCICGRSARIGATPRGLPLFGAACLALACLFLALAAPSVARGVQDVRDAKAVMRHVEILAGLGDRSLGSEGAARAADYVQEAFEKAGPGETGRQQFQAPVRRHRTSEIRLRADGNGGAKTAPLRPLLMNALSPGTIAPPGLSGRLVWVGRGSFAEMNGKAIDGSVVLMDLDSGKNWMNAASLGAKALIFVERGSAEAAGGRGEGAASEDAARLGRTMAAPNGSSGAAGAEGSTHSTAVGPDEVGASTGTNGQRLDGLATRGVFEEKWELTPLEFPRFWMEESQARELFGEYERFTGDAPSPEATLTSDVRWRRARADNVWKLIPGADPKLSAELVVVEASYDSQAMVAGRSPGADEASSAAALIELAAELERVRPGRSVLLVATCGRSQALAGMREFVWSFASSAKELRALERELSGRRERAEKMLAALNADTPLENADPAFQAALRQSLDSRLKTESDELTQALMRLRLEAPQEKERIRALADRRLLLRRLSWRSDFANLSSAERAALAEVIPRAAKEFEELREDAAAQLRALKSARNLRAVIQDREIVASASLLLSSHGDGLGSFGEGFLYALRPEINRTQVFAPLSKLLGTAAAEEERTLGLAGFYRDGLRPSRLTPWQSLLPDRPQLGGEAAALAGQLGFTLATVNDGRVLWGTPHDLPSRVDADGLARQTAFASGLLRRMIDADGLKTDLLPRNGFATLTGRARFIRQGEVFAEQPAPGAVIQAYQGQSALYAMVDEEGVFRLKGLADKRHMLEKAIIEGYKFTPETGDVKWAIDKAKTGKNAYRVRMNRLAMDTDLVMFPCRSIALFGLLEPRNFRPLTKVEVLDGLREAQPVHYWFSRMDTRQSSIAGVYLPEGVPLKMTLSDTVLRRKMILLNATPEDPDGKGYLPERWPALHATEYRAAKDMWTLVAPRAANLEARGVHNELVQSMLGEGQGLLGRAEKALAERRYDAFMEDARSSLALASQVYNDIDATQRDVLVGVLFYVALFVPFAYCLERLLFAYVDIHRRIMAFLAILAATIAVIYQVHPAFQLTYSPMVVILAFFILGLSAMVAMIIFLRFEKEMALLQQRARHVRTSEISRWKAFAAAFALGVSNLRRRKLRTALTCATLIILTFTIMSFTSVKSQRGQSAALFSPQATWSGALLKYLTWQPLPPEALQVVRNRFADRALVAPRGWLASQDGTEARPALIEAAGRRAEARGVMGVSVEEAAVSGLDKALAAGRWFAPGERQAVVLPERMARSLETGPGRRVTIQGADFEVVGIMRAEAVESRPDLDGEPLTPVFFPSGAARELSEAEMEAAESGEDVTAAQGRYQHVAAEQTVWLPYATLAAMGGSLKSIAVGGLGDAGREGVSGAALAERFGLAVFSGEPAGSLLYNAADALNYSGLPNIVIPLVISALIVLNTMIGSVYERKREIAVYTSVGLAPSHVSFLFIAESLAFAVISVVLGYLLAQVSAGLFAGTGLWRGLTANYSSLSGVAAMILVIAVTLVSVIYPSKVAADIAIPDVNRSWSMPEPRGDVIDVTLPFLLKSHEQECAGGYLCEYYASHKDVSHGLFSTGDMSVDYACPIDLPAQASDGRQGDEAAPAREGAGGEAGQAFGCLAEGGRPPRHPEPGAGVGVECLRFCSQVWLAPFDFGVRQSLTIHFCPAQDNPGFMEIRVNIRREAGEAGAWKRMNKAFLNDLRKQLLVWRSLDEEARFHYEQALQKLARPSLAGLGAEPV